VKHSNRNFVLAYIFLVALPVAGLAGVLRSGRNLKAPMTIAGAWNVQVNADQLAALPCGKSLASANPAFTISQSGRTFTLSFAASPLASAMGTLDGAAIQASVVPWPAIKAGACGSGQTLSLTANVDAQSTPKKMTGVLRVNDCADCAPVEFQAFREDQAKGAR